MTTKPPGVVPISDLESVAQAAQRYGYTSPTFIYRLIRQDRLPAWEVAGRLVVLKSDVDKLLPLKKPAA